MTCRGRRSPKRAGTRCSSEVAVSAPVRRADRVPQRQRSPSSWPPPQSPEIVAERAGTGRSVRRARRPCSSSPNRRRCPTPQSRSVPARSTANVSLRRTWSSTSSPRRRVPRRDPPVVDRQVRAGQAEDAAVRRRCPSEVDPGIGARRADRVADLRQERVVARPCRSPGARHARGPEHARRPSSRKRRVDLRAAAVDREQAGRSHGSRSSSSTVTNVAPAARSPAIVLADRVAGSAGPRVEQDDRAVAVVAARRRARSERSPHRCATAPSPRPRRPSGRCGSRAPERRASTRGSSWPAPNGQRNHGRGSRPVASAIAAAPSSRSVRSPSSRAAAGERGSASGGRPDARRRGSGEPSRGAPSAQRPWTKNVARDRRPRRARRGCAGRSPAGTTGGPDAPRRTSARRGRSLTGGHLRGVDVGARASRPAAAASRHASSCDRHDRDRRARAAGRGVRARSRARASPSRRSDHEDRGAERPRARGRWPSVEDLRRGLGRDHDRGQVRPGELERAVAELGGLQRLDRRSPTASFSVSAPISAAARAPPRPRITVVARPPCHAASRSGERVVGEEPSIAASPPSSASPLDLVGAGPAGRPRERAPRPRATAANVIVDGPVSCAGPGVEHVRRPSRASVLAGAVRDRHRRAAVAGVRAAPRRRPTVSALSPDWLTSDDDVVGLDGSATGSAASSAASSMRSRDAARARARSRRGSGVVGAAHPGEHERAAAARAAPIARSVRRVLDRGRGRPPKGVGLARDLGDEWVRKVS